MKTLNEFQEINEYYSKSSGFNATEDMIFKLEKFLHVNSNISKSLQREFGPGMKKDFAKMQHNLAAIIDVWEDIEYTVGMQDED